MAGCFYDRERSEIFRKTWPKVQEYVDLKWPHFVKAVRDVYAELLGRPDVSEAQKEEMYEALITDAEKITSDGASSPIQIAKDSEAFVGDRNENRKIVAIIGKNPRSVRARLRTTTALFP